MINITWGIVSSQATVSLDDQMEVVAHSHWDTSVFIKFGGANIGSGRFPGCYGEQQGGLELRAQLFGSMKDGVEALRPDSKAIEFGLFQVDVDQGGLIQISPA